MLHSKPGYQLFSIPVLSRDPNMESEGERNEMQYYFYVLSCNPELIGISDWSHFGLCAFRNVQWRPMGREAT